MAEGGMKETPEAIMEVDEPAYSSEDEDLSNDGGTIVDGIYIPQLQLPTLSLDPNGPRLIITKITNNFFKSYGENVVVGPFSKVVIPSISINPP